MAASVILAVSVRRKSPESVTAPVVSVSIGDLGRVGVRALLLVERESALEPDPV